MLHALQLVIVLPLLPMSTVLADDPAWIARSKLGMVASDSPEASRVGANVLAAGGNAFDAAVATSFALAVARPQSTGLGGGGFMLAYVAKDDRFVALDFRETAPAAATPQRYARLHADRGDGPSPSITGGNAVGVPGQLAGLAEINTRFGTRPFASLIQPAIELAETGFVIDKHFLQSRQDILDDFQKWPQLEQSCGRILQFLTPGEAAPKPGDLFERPHLARALRLIATEGTDAFYNGPIGEAVVSAVNAAGGSMTMDDLRGYRVKQRTPMRNNMIDPMHEYQHEIVSMPPPSSGGICHAEILNIIAGCTVRSDMHPVTDRQHVLIEAMKNAMADRARWMGDPDFTEIPLAGLTSLRYAARLAREIRPGRTRPAAEYGTTTVPPDDGGTSHFCVTDRFGNVVALTETVNGSFGSLVIAEPFGIVLNNEMDDFTTAVGESNLFDLVQSSANLVGPGKRPLSSMSPTILLKGGKPRLVVGGSGGPRIITSVVQVILHIMDGCTLGEAMSAIRLHHQWQPDEVFFDREAPADLVENLTAHGHKVSAKRKGAAVQAILLLDDGTMVGASDPDKGGRPAGVD